MSRTIFEIEGEKAKAIMEEHAKGRTPTEIMKQTGFSMSWIRQVIDRSIALRKLKREREHERG